MALPSIGIVIPTYQAAKHLSSCLTPLLASPLNPQILVIDSSSTDETIEIAKAMGVQTLVIPKSEFNHGATREKGRLYLNTDIAVMITQDAYATSKDSLECLVEPIIEKKASIAYARQIPHVGSGFFEAFPRSFNYPAVSHIRSIKDVDRYGVYTFFCSNSCAAYSNEALDEVRGFPTVLFGEDSIVVAKLLQSRHHIAYVASSEFRHSHDYSLKQEFHRHFDMGFVRSHHRQLLQIKEKDSKRGKAYVKGMLKELKRTAPFLIPYALLQSSIKLVGYHVGANSLNFPLWLKKKLSGQKAYWVNQDGP